METVQKADSKHLQPFHHQVAGQSLVFRYDATTICKSLIPREHEIYIAMPSALKPFVPDYRGVADISIKTNSMTAEQHHHPDNNQTSLTYSTPHPRATERHLAKVAKSEDEEHVYHFILLENIVAGYRHPCVLDLKLGTRQHGDDAPEDKVIYQVNKCRITTSSELGVRLCGMKVYQSTTGEYLLTDKAQGRRMRGHDFHRAVQQFLHNGRNIHKDIIPSILVKLKGLKAVIAELPTYRFYSSSLLIVYDGETATNSTHPNGCRRPNRQMYKCRSSGYEAGEAELAGESTREVLSSGTNSQAFHGPNTNLCVVTKENIPNENSILANAVLSGKLDDTSCTKGNHKTITNGQTVATDQRPSETTITRQNGSAIGEEENPDLARPCCHQTESDSDGRPLHHSDKHPQEGGKENNSGGDGWVECDSMQVVADSETSQSLVDVRLVDFAHTTFAGFGEDTVVHQGVDHGCLLGLQTLINVFTQIQESVD